MFKRLILPVALFAWANAFAAEQCDTILQATDAELTILETDTCLHVVISDQSGQHVLNEPYPEQVTVSSRQRTTHVSAQIWGNDRMSWDLISGLMLVGFNHATGASEFFDMGRSIELSWLQTLGFSLKFHKSGCTLSAALGLTWRNYRTRPDVRLTADENGRVYFAPYSDDITPQSSRIKMFSLSLPVLFSQNINLSSNLRLGYSLGPVLNFNPHASLRSRWLDGDGVRQRESTSRIAHRKFTTDLFASVGVNGISVYVRYSPMSVLTKGLDFSSLSTGLVFNF